MFCALSQIINHFLTNKYAIYGPWNLKIALKFKYAKQFLS